MDRWTVHLSLVLAILQVAAGAAADAPPDCAGRAGQLQCDGLCRRLGVCLDGGGWMALKDCGAHGLVCSGGRCVAEGADCPTAAAARCLDDGIFPDLTDCTQYVECADVTRARERARLARTKRQTSTQLSGHQSDPYNRGGDAMDGNDSWENGLTENDASDSEDRDAGVSWGSESSEGVASDSEDSGADGSWGSESSEGVASDSEESGADGNWGSESSEGVASDSEESGADGSWGSESSEGVARNSEDSDGGVSSEGESSKSDSSDTLATLSRHCRDIGDSDGGVGFVNGDKEGGAGASGEPGRGDGAWEVDWAPAGAVRRCPRGTAFDACTGRCDVAAGGACAWERPASCAKAGAFGVAPHNDRLYYACVVTPTGVVVPYWSRCALGHFNVTSRRCEGYETPGCQMESETPPPDPGTTTTTTTTTEAPSAQTTSEAPQCSVGAHPDPNTDCSYFFCDPDGNMAEVHCKTGFHFEPAAGQCVLGPCKQARGADSAPRGTAAAG